MDISKVLDTFEIHYKHLKILMNTLVSNGKDIKKASSVHVNLEANLKAHRALLDTKIETGISIQLKHFYSQLIEVALTDPSIIKTTINNCVEHSKVN